MRQQNQDQEETTGFVYVEVLVTFMLTFAGSQVGRVLKEFRSDGMEK